MSRCGRGRLQILPKAPPVQEFQHSDRRGPPNSRGTHRLTSSYFLCYFVFSCSCRVQGNKFPWSFPRKKFRFPADVGCLIGWPPSVRMSRGGPGRLQILPKAPPVQEFQHSDRRGPPNSRGTHRWTSSVFVLFCVLLFLPGARK